MFLTTIPLVALLSTVRMATAVSFPPPSGSYSTTLETVQLTDTKRIDPLSPTHQARKFMISIFTPAQPSMCKTSLAPYMDSQTAAYQDAKFASYGIPAGLFGSLELQVCTIKTKSAKTAAGKYPIIVFSPALGTTRLFYSALAQQVASQGYIVVTVDHPYDVDIVTFPDNSTIEGVDIPDEALTSALTTRVKDISFVLNQLATAKFAKAHFSGIPGLACTGGLDVSRVGVFGHSFGGAAAAEAMASDGRLIAGANLDGTFFGKVLDKGLRNPFLIFAHDGKNRTTDPSWETLWPKLTGWKKELMLKGAQHYTFSDLPDLLKVAGIADQLPAEVAELLGTIDGARAMKVVGTYVEAVFGRFLKKEKRTLLDGSSKTFPEVLFE